MRLPLIAASVLAASAAFAANNPLAAYRWSARVVVASAETADDPALLRQRAIFGRLGAEAKARDLVLVEAVGDSAGARALRQTLGIGRRGFTAVLVGKDGGAKLRASHPLDAAELFPVIDAMSMRRQEIRERGQ
jgi:Domain of unknown function (DUF4174)